MFDCHFAIELDSRATRVERDRYVEWLRSEADALGVDRLCLVTRYPKRGETLEACRRNNRLLGTLADERSEFLHAWAFVDARWGADAVQEFRRAVEEDGLLGLKRGPDVNCDDPSTYPLAEAAIEMAVAGDVDPAGSDAVRRRRPPQVVRRAR